MKTNIENTIIKRGLPYKKEYKKILSAIKKYDHIALFRHITPDYDALGCQFGMYQWIKDNFPNKDVVCLGDNHVSYSGSLFPLMDKVNQSWFEQPFLAIIMDVANTPRIADPRYKKAKYKIRIDHHPQTESWGKVVLIDSSFVSCSELIANMFLNIKGDFKISKETANCLYIGIVGDSGSFKYKDTTSHTFAISYELINRGVDVTETTLKMFHKKYNELELKKYVLNNFNLTEHGVAYYVLSDEIQKKLAIETEQGKEAINLFANTDGINIWVSVTEDVTDKTYKYRVSIRSNSLDISKVASNYNGGGHANASGARLKKISELEPLIKDLDKIAEEKVK